MDLIQKCLHCRPAKHLTAPSHVFLLQCESVVRSAYECPWYEASEGFKRSIRIMVVRSMKPFRLTGGKLYIMSLDTFVAVRYFGASKEKIYIYVTRLEMWQTRVDVIYFFPGRSLLTKLFTVP